MSFLCRLLGIIDLFIPSINHANVPLRHPSYSLVITHSQSYLLNCRFKLAYKIWISCFFPTVLFLYASLLHLSLLFWFPKRLSLLFPCNHFQFPCYIHLNTCLFYNLNPLSRLLFPLLSSLFSFMTYTSIHQRKNIFANMCLPMMIVRQTEMRPVKLISFNLHSLII